MSAHDTLVPLEGLAVLPTVPASELSCLQCEFESEEVKCFHFTVANLFAEAVLFQSHVTYPLLISKKKDLGWIQHMKLISELQGQVMFQHWNASFSLPLLY